MRYTVTWTAAAENQLAAVWLAAADRNAVNLASRRLDVLLADQPETLGNELFDTVRTAA